MEKKNVDQIEDQILEERYKSIVITARALMYGAAGLILAVNGWLSPRTEYDNHSHQLSRIERTLYDYDKDGRYDAGTIRMTFKDGRAREEKLPWYATGKTRRDYEEIFKRIDSLDSLQEIEETLTFK